tara:strand:- start:48 stop:497 length:450 start_codon:yes stop_codon:yes gene_type:complete
MAYVNNILAMSTLIFILPIQVSILKKRWGDLFLLTNIFIFSVLHHLVETNEAGHNLEGNPYFFLLSKYSCSLRYLDISFSYLLFGYIIYMDGFLFILSFLKTYKITFILFLINLTCDLIISNSPLLYLFLHLIWHFGIANILTEYYGMK